MNLLLIQDKFEKLYVKYEKDTTIQERTIKVNELFSVLKRTCEIGRIFDEC